MLNCLQILSNNGANIGKIKKQYGGLVQEMFTDADKFSIECSY